ncbi:uncharacterized protein LOC123703875 isoform X2 [Colias croceus]|uniref:uncharacterized protein LOC123703875 isoform X2 n=1 Tax=Colias crocea TaxID=72248 RepID=UPI001E28005C|nr:uncharacterized protein LOC123703875 isoform X2 [Colias croceus]
MGLINSKEIMTKRKIDEATSNTSLSNLRYVIATNKSKWKLFRKREIAPIPAYTAASMRPVKGCPCGNNGPCKQKITPKGVTIHYPQKKKKLFGANKGYVPPQNTKSYYNSNNPRPKVKIVRERKFPTWRLDKIIYYRPILRRSLV